MSPYDYDLVALVPIKANSERVPGKNFRNFAGRPLFQWIIGTLLKVELIEKIVINTDAKEELIRNDLKLDGRIIVRSRPPELCGDLVSMNRVIHDDLNSVHSKSYLMTHVTNPLLSEATIRGALEVYRNGLECGNDSLFSVNKIQTRFYREDGSAVNHDPDKLLRTQDLEPWFEENSNLYIFNKDSFQSTGARIGEKPILYPTPHMESADIDDATGWHLAEIIALSQLIGESTRHYREA